MFRYAQIDSEGLVIAISELKTEVINDFLIPLGSNIASLGDIYRDGEFFAPEIDLDGRTVYTIIDESVSTNGQPLTKYMGRYSCNPGDLVQLQCTLTDGENAQNITIPVTLKMPLVRHAAGKPTQDEIYLNVTLNNGVMTATGVIERSGDWKILIDRVNEALLNVDLSWKIEHPDVTFLA